MVTYWLTKQKVLAFRIGKNRDCESRHFLILALTKVLHSKLQAKFNRMVTNGLSYDLTQGVKFDCINMQNKMYIYAKSKGKQ